MNAESARLYYIAAQDDPFVAAWISVLDEYRLAYRAEVAPHDWGEAFEQLFNLGFVTEDQFNQLDYKKVFRGAPSLRDIEAALNALSFLRAARTQEVFMPDPFDLFKKPNQLAPRNGSGHALDRPASGFAPLQRSSSEKPIDALKAPDEPRPGRTFPMMAPTRRALEQPVMQQQHGLDCQRIDPDDRLIDPRTYIKDFHPQVICCGKELKLEYDEGRDVTSEVEDSSRNATLYEFIFHSLCAECETEGHHSFVKPMPLDFQPR